MPRDSQPGVLLYRLVKRLRDAPPVLRDGPAGRQTAEDVRARAHAAVVELGLPELTPRRVLASLELDVRVQRLE